MEGNYSFTNSSGIIGSATTGSLTDTYGTTFPSVDTAIGKFTTASASVPTIAASTVKYSKESPSVMHTTQPLEQASQPQTNLLMPALLALLSIVGVALLVFPRKA